MRKFISITFLLTTFWSQGQSVLSSGNWYKIGITESGIYKLDREFLRRDLKINGSVDPATIKVFGIKGGMLPQQNSISRPIDPVEIPLLAFGDQDGSLDNDDYFLFYGQGSDGFYLDESGNPVFENNLYSDTAYFFITHGSTPGLRISGTDAPPNSTNVVSEYLDYYNHEIDEHNQLRSGRNWLGEKFRRNEGKVQTFSYAPENIGNHAKVWIRLGASSEADCDFDVLINEQQVGNVSIEAIPNVIYGLKLKYADGFFESDFTGSKVDLKLNFNPASGVNSSTGYLDGFTLGITRRLSMENTKIHQIFLPTLEDRTLSIQQANANTKVWNVTNPLSPKEMIGTLNGSNLSFSTNQNALIIFNQTAAFETPQFFHEIGNQDIKVNAYKSGIIVTSPEFISAAKELAQFHQDFDGFSVGVVTTPQIYNEFSGGRQDITAIRDFLRYCYNEGGNLEQALLFGDASYDYKKRVNNNSNYIPVYESRESSNNLFSHSSDDYFAFFEEHEGYWKEDSLRNNSLQVLKLGEDHTMEIGIGRLPVKSRSEAEGVVSKIIRYKTAKQEFGKWRNQVAYFTDDGDNAAHMIQAEAFYQIIDTLAPQYNSQKLYLDIYDQRNKQSEPEAMTAVKNALKDGVFMFNYMGHGNESQLTQENIINLELIRELTNRHKLPLFITATCEFGKYDNPIIISGAERLLLNENGGAIALLTTTRPVYAHTNYLLNKALHENLFRQVSGNPPRLGDVIKRTKNESLKGSINRNFALLGDPMLTLNYPQFDAVFDQMENTTDTLSALEDYYLSGRILSDGQLVSDFNGQAIITVYDIPQKKLTKGQENDPFQFVDQTNALFRGEVSVKNGLFELNFILPKNISYKYQEGKVTIYAWNENVQIDASGASRNFVLGGTAENAAEDTSAPLLTLYLNDDNFKNGNTVGPNSLFIAQIKDESGINISNDGITAGITLQLNDDAPINLNAYYTAARDTYTQGAVLFPLQNLAPGNYTATLKVLDAYNNTATSRVDFTVSEKPIIRLYNVVNYPNPISLARDQATTFKFEHDREDEELKVSIVLYDMNGQIVRNINYDLDSSPRNVDNLMLKTYDQHGVELQAGIYMYRMVVTSTLDNATNEVVKRLIIIN